MKKRKIIYLIVTLIFIILTIGILTKTDLSNNVTLSKSIQIILPCGKSYEIIKTHEIKMKYYENYFYYCKI